jgi:hypothetical protein
MTSFSKVYEKVMCNKLLEHLNDNTVAEEQFGFRKNLTTEKATHELITEIVQTLNDKFVVGGILCDLSKAYVRVNHDILVPKLNFYGITGKAYE